MKKGVVKIAGCQFRISLDIRKNANNIRKQIEQAKDKGARIAHFPEGALSGYIFDPALDGRCDWDVLTEETRSIMALAKKKRIWVAMGSAHRLSGKRKPFNCVYIIDSKGVIAERYDKCFGTTADIRHYTSGDRLCMFEINGVKFGVMICYDTWFVEMYRAYKKNGVHCILHSVNGIDGEQRESKGGFESPVGGGFSQTNAMINGFWISSINRAGKVLTPSAFVRPSGDARRMPLNRATIHINQIDLSETYWDPSGLYRPLALRGKLSNGKHFKDPRKNRKLL